MSCHARSSNGLNLLKTNRFHVLRFLPLAIILGTAAVFLEMLLAGGMTKITAWYLLQMVLPVSGVIGLLFSIVRSLVVKRLDRTAVVTGIASLLAVLIVVVLVYFTVLDVGGYLTAPYDPDYLSASLINAVLGQERAIVSNIPGTTRDAVDTPFQWKDRDLVFVDTAGIRRAGKVQGSVEYYSVLRAMRAMERADVALLVIDAEAGLLDGDKRVGGYTCDANCGCVIVVNKWDLVPDRSPRARREFEMAIREQMPFLSYAPVAFTSALERKGMDPVIDSAMVACDNFNRRIPTGELNRVLRDWVDRRPFSRKGRDLKVYYATMAHVRPPTVTLFVNDPELVHFSYKRYITNQLREKFGFAGTPLSLTVRRAEGETNPAKKKQTRPSGKSG